MTHLFHPDVQQKIREGEARIEGPRRKPGTDYRLTLIEVNGDLYRCVTHRGRAR